MEDLSLHVLDIVENSIRSEAKLVEISLVEDEENDVLELTVEDDGKGMPTDVVSRAPNPFFSTKTSRQFGLGLPLLAQACREAGGSFDLSSAVGKGTRVRAVFRYSHPDRKPIGRMALTLETLVVAHPAVDFVYEHRIGSRVARLDTRQLRTTPGTGGNADGLHSGP